VSVALASHSLSTDHFLDPSNA